jgi:nucleoid-associated protein YgaU
MASSTRTFVVANVVLVSLIGGMIWYLSTRGQTEFISLPSSEISPVVAESKVLAEGVTAKDIQAIEALQAQLVEEHKRAQITRSKLQAREQEITATNQQQDNLGLEVAQQTQRIAQMIKNQLQGAEAENKRLTQALLQKDQEIAAVKKQSSVFARKLIKLDNSAQSLLTKLVADANNISSSDQDYLGAMQALQDNTVSPQASIDLTEIDLINRVEIADSGDTGSIAAQLRTAVDELMESEKNNKPSTTTNSATVSSSGQATDLQLLVDKLMVRNEEQKAQRQFQTDSKYLDSLTPMEKERLNETRWVTVRQGDTLYNIAERVYNDGWLYRKLFEANPQVLANPDLITPGQRLRVPL